MDPRDPLPTFIAIQQQLPAAQLRRQRERLFRILLWVLAGFALVLVVLGIMAARFDPNAHRAQIEATMRTATGRDFHINGRMTLTSWRHMTIAASDVTLANVAGGSKPEMMHLGRVEADLRPISLMLGYIRIPRLVLEDAEILLETDAHGRGNWQFAPPPAATPATPATSPGKPAPARRDAAEPRVVVLAVHLRDAHVTWRDGRTGQTADATLRRFTTSENPRDGSIVIGAELLVGAQAIVFNGTTSSIDRLLDPTTSGPPWGAVMTGEIPGLRVTVAGTVERPLQGSGYKLRVDGVATDTSGLSNLLGRTLPPLHNMTLALQLADGADGTAELSNMSLQVGSSDLDSLVRGMKIESAVLSAKTASDPIRLEAKGTVTATDLRVSAVFGTLTDVLTGSAGLPVDLSASVGESTLSVQGTAPTLRSDATFDVGVQLRLKDLANLSPFVGHKLPAIRPVTFSGRIAMTGEGGFALRDGSLVMPDANVGADVDFALGARPALGLYLRGERLDMDALMAAFSNVSFAPPSDAMPLGALPIPRSVRPVISDQKLSLGWMDLLDLDLEATLDTLTLGGMTARSVSGQATLRDGRLIVKPLSGTLPGGPFDMTLDIDSHAPTPPVALTVKAPALDLRPMLQAFGRTEDISGLLEVDADLRGAGGSLHDIAGTLTGHLGLSMVDGTIDNALLGPLLGGVMRVARVPSDLLFGPGRSRLRCFAVRLDATEGHGTVAALALDVGRALVQGSGTMELRDETLDMRLRPLLRVTKSGITIPLKLTGRFRTMAVALDGAAADAGVGSLSALSGRAVGTVAPEREADACPAALVIARGGNTTEVTPAEPPPAPLLPFRMPQLPGR